MLDQIREDLAPFRIIKRSDLLAEMRQDRAKENQLVLVEIIHNKVDISGHTEISPERATLLSRFLHQLAAHRSLPNVSFILSLHDSFEAVGLFAKDMGNIPVFTFAKHKEASSILFPDFESFDTENQFREYEKFCKKHPWETKKPIVFWRGGTTGGSFATNTYLDFPRIQFVKLATLHPDWIDAAFNGLSQGAEHIDALKAYVKPHVPIQDHFAYKYLIDIDGNSCTYSRCRWILLSNSTLLKVASDNIQWYYKKLQPYVHYVPVKAHLEDLPTVYEWLHTHDEKAKSIALQGQRLGREIFSRAAIEGYVCKLLWEYSHLYNAEKPRNSIN